MGAPDALSVAEEPFEWEGYCTRCHYGVSWESDDTPETAREAVCHDCDKILCREEGSEAERAAIVAWLRTPTNAGEMPLLLDVANEIEAGEHVVRLPRVGGDK